MIVLGLGSNKGDRLAHLKDAIAALSAIAESITCSPVYESPALLPPEAPPEWNLNFFNMAVCGETKLSPQELLANVKKIENDLGRTFSGHWGPREIDIDILAYGDCVVNEKDLIIPHSYLLVRDFALIPLADIAPDWAYPVAGEFYNINAKTLAGNLAYSLHKTNFTV